LGEELGFRKIVFEKRKCFGSHQYKSCVDCGKEFVEGEEVWSHSVGVGKRGGVCGDGCARSITRISLWRRG